jgi:CrcB protein
MTEALEPAVEATEEAELAHAPQDRSEPPPPLWRDRLATFGPISTGGLLGANARYLVGRWVTDHAGGAFPWGTLLINVAGSFVLGLYLTIITERIRGRATTRLFFATGFLGAFTTFSTFSYETMALFRDDKPFLALTYVVASLVIGLAAAITGIAATRVVPFSLGKQPGADGQG